MKKYLILLLLISSLIVFTYPEISYSVISVPSQFFPQTSLTFETDKGDYYTDSRIFVNGTMIDIDWSKDTTITYIITRGGKIIHSGDSNSLQNNGTFNFMIDVSEWNGNTDNYDNGVYPFNVTIQNKTAQIGFDFHNTINMTPETLYEMNMEQYEILDEHDVTLDEHDVKLDEYDVTLDEYDVTLDEHDVKLDEYDVTLDEYETIIDNQQSILDVIVSFLENLGFIFTEPIQPKVINSASTELKCGAGTYLDRGACIIIDDTSLCKAGTELINGYCKVL